LVAAFGLSLAGIGTVVGIAQAGASARPSHAARSPSVPSLRGAGARPSHPAPSASVPSLQGPIPGPDQSNFASYPLSQVGYRESEFFFSGTATAYTPKVPLTSDGKWSVQPGAQTPYKSRVIVLQPANPAKFNGTVVVEWFNVTSGFDAGVDWSFGHDEMIRSGDVYVGVSAQAVGVNQLKTSNPGRYGSLVHPGDSFSYDMFSQAGMAVRDLASQLLPGLHPKTVIADGESQSAFRLTTYVDAVAPLVNVFDGYLIHSRGGGSAPLSQAPQAAINTPSTVFIRDDLTVPVLNLQTETDVLGPLAFFPARQPDNGMFRLWEVAGTSHVDSYLTLQESLQDDNSWGSDLTQFATMTSPPSGLTVTLPSGPLVLSCPGNLNTGEHHYVYQTALDDLIRWARAGIAPPHMARFEVDTSGAQPSYRLDQNGNVLGGVRTPAVDAPIATISGLPVAGAPSFCIFFGQTHPFTPSKLSALYPTHADFVHAWDKAVEHDLHAGSLLPADAQHLIDVVSGER
jgi:hypothetical protein